MRRFVVQLAVYSLLVSPCPADGRQRAWLSDSQTASERRFDEAFGQPASLDFDKVSLDALLDYFSEMTKIDIAIDHKALAEEGIRADTPVSIHVNHASYKSALRLALDQLGLTWLLRGEVVLVTTNYRCEALPTTKIYDVRDLVEASASRSPDFRPLVELITSCIAPTTWDEVGGPGAIRAYQSTKIRALAISQSLETHEEISSLLTDLRTLAGRSGAKLAVNTVRRKSQAAVQRTKARLARNYVAPPDWSLPQVHE